MAIERPKFCKMLHELHSIDIEYNFIGAELTDMGAEFPIRDLFLYVVLYLTGIKSFLIPQPELIA